MLIKFLYSSGFMMVSNSESSLTIDAGGKGEPKREVGIEFPETVQDWIMVSGSVVVKSCAMLKIFESKRIPGK